MIKIIVFLFYFFILGSEPISKELLDQLFPEEIVEGGKFFMTTTSTQLGNACFMAAAGVGYAIENGYAFVLDPAVKKRYPTVFHRFPSYEIVNKPKKELFHQERFNFSYEAIDESTNILGWCNSDFWFSKYKNIAIELFGPTKEMVENLQEKYREYFREDKNYVGVHLRTFVTPFEDKNYVPLEYFQLWDLSPDYYRKAMKLFPKDTVFVIFSDNTQVAKKLLSKFKHKFIFNESSDLYEDFYLMSMMKSMIIPNSSFSAFACCLNKRSDQVVVKPPNGSGVSIINNNWKVVNYTQNFSRISKWYEICRKEFQKADY